MAIFFDDGFAVFSIEELIQSLLKIYVIVQSVLVTRGFDHSHPIYGTTFRIVKPVYNDHPWDPKVVAVVDRWLLFRGHLSDKKLKRDPTMMVFVGKWSLTQVLPY